MKPNSNVTQLGITVVIIAIVIVFKGLSLHNVAEFEVPSTIDSKDNLGVDQGCQYACCKNHGDLPPFTYRCPNHQNRE